ncbi:MAG: hypothetical protein ACRC0V_11585, partial [Fusobacteriaceae bacterium]
TRAKHWFIGVIMTKFDINMNQSELNEIQQMMSTVKNGAEKSIAKAINFALIRGQRGLIKEVLSTYFVNKDEVLKSLTLQRAKTQNLEGRIISKSRVLQLYKHKVDIKNGEVYASVRKDKSPVLRKGAFVQKVKSFTGKGTYSETDIKSRIFKSRGGKLITLHGASIPGMMGNDKINRNVLAGVNEMLQQRITVEMIKLLGD